MAIDKELLEILACPKCKGPIALNKAGNGLLCTACELLYEIEDDIPIMLIDEAKPFSAVPAGRLDGKKKKPAKKKKSAKKKKPAKKKARKATRGGKGTG